MLTLISHEGPTCRNLFSQLIPFAALYYGPNHPDGMDLSDGNVDLRCFFYEPPAERPRIVVWLPHQAMDEYFRREDADFDAVRYADITLSVAQDFDQFLKLLRPESS